MQRKITLDNLHLKPRCQMERLARAIEKLRTLSAKQADRPSYVFYSRLLGA